MNLGIIADESADDYHGSEAVSASKLRVFARRPGGAQLYYQRFISRTLADDDSEARLFGRALHCAVLEPVKFDEQYIAVPDDAPDRPTQKMREAKKPSESSIVRVAWWDNFERETKGKTILSTRLIALLKAMSSQIRAHPAAMQLLEGGQAETTLRIEAGGYKNLPPIQCRPDKFNLDGCSLSGSRRFMVDLKTTATLEEDAFANFLRGAEEHLYHVQAALYMAIAGALGLSCYDFFFVACEKEPPYGVEVYRISDRALEEGQRIADQLLGQLDRCYGRNEWPNTELGVKELKLSPRYWARKDNSEILAPAY